MDILDKPLEPWRFMQYTGYRRGRAAFGRSGAQGDIFQASGVAADIARELSPPHLNVSRCDIQITMWYDADNPDVAQRLAPVALDYADKRGRAGARPRLISGYGTGDTLYVGSRSSDVFIRIYDKWRESKLNAEFQYAWRFEVELGGDAAKRAWRGDITDGEYPGMLDVASIVSAYMRRRGIELPELSGVYAREIPKPDKDTDAQTRSLQWLRNQVSPTIGRLLTDGIELDQVLDALGLSDKVIDVERL
jgi:hypothetical protein